MFHCGFVNEGNELSFEERYFKRSLLRHSYWMVFYDNSLKKILNMDTYLNIILHTDYSKIEWPMIKKGYQLILNKG